MPIPVMVNGLPGKMATLVAQKIAQDPRFELFGASLTGPEITEFICKIDDHAINLISPGFRFPINDQLHRQKPIAVDFTHPSATLTNAGYYGRFGLSFVMGTTGGDKQAIETVVRDSNIAAVIAPNMAKQIVLLQAMLQFAAQNFPKAFAGYILEIVESHQKGKADTSGTAKAMVKHFNDLGIPFAADQIVMIRDPMKQLAMGVPEAALTGHGWHTYTLRSPTGDVLIQFTHNINQRDPYVLGVIDALLFLQNRPPGVYTMIDVLKNQSP